MAAGRSLFCFAAPARLALLPTLTGRRAWNPTWVCVGLASVLPGVAVLLLLLHLATGAHTWTFMDWYVLYYLSLNLALLLIPRDSWARLVAISPDVAAVIKSPADSERLVARIRHMVRFDVQLLLSVAGVIAGLAAALATADARNVGIVVAIPFVLSVGVTLGLGALVVAWIAYGMHWLYVFSHLQSVRYDSVDPMRTPGLRLMYALLARAQMYCTLGLLLALAPLVLLYNQARGSAFLRLALALAGTGSLVVVLLAYTMPPWLIHLTRVRDKEKLLDELREDLPATLVGVQEEDLRLVERRLTLYADVQARPTRRGDRVLVTSLGLSVATIGAAFIPLLLAR